MPTSKPILPFPDYCRIFRVIYSVLDGRAHTHRGCIFFAVAGAFLLQRHYGLNAIPVAGAAAYMVSEENSLVATFGKIEEDMLVSASDAFHCWVECDGYAIDFMAPVFRENLQSAGLLNTVPRRMLQRPLIQMVSTLSELTHEGSFSLARSIERTEQMHASFSAKHASSDLMNVCAHWYRRPPKRMSETLDMGNDLGEVVRLKLHGPEITGVW